MPREGPILPPLLQDYIPFLCLLALVLFGYALLGDRGLSLVIVFLLEGFSIVCFLVSVHALELKYTFTCIEWTDKMPLPPRITFSYTLLVLFLLRPTWHSVSKLPLTLSLTFLLDMRILDARRGSLLLSRIRRQV
jgi:hypothetical protein